MGQKQKLSVIALAIWLGSVTPAMSLGAKGTAAPAARGRNSSVVESFRAALHDAGAGQPK
jgi:hypothetical protein